MEIDAVYENVEDKGFNHKQAEGKAKKCRPRCLVLITVSLGLICVLLLVFIILQHFSTTAERDLLQKKGWFFMSTEAKNWSDSRQYCRDRGADLVIINTEEKQRFISSLTTEFVWIGLSDTEQEGNMKWVDNSPLKQGFWARGEPNNLGDIENCVDLNPEKLVLRNWNDLSCSNIRHWICEK